MTNNSYKTIRTFIIFAEITDKLDNITLHNNKYIIGTLFQKMVKNKFLEM